MPPTIPLAFEKDVCQGFQIGGMANIRKVTMGGNSSKCPEVKSKRILKHGGKNNQTRSACNTPVTAETETAPVAPPKKRKSSKVAKAAAVAKQSADASIKKLDADENLVQSGAEDDELPSMPAPASQKRKPSFSDDDDEDPTQITDHWRKKSRKQYYLKDASGKPSEKFSTEYAHQMRNGEGIDDYSDDDGPFSYISLTDRWRPEWDNVQILINPHHLPTFNTRKANDVPDLPPKPLFRRPAKYIATCNPIEPCTSYVRTLGGFEVFRRPKTRFYQGDALDMTWVKCMNETRASEGRPELDVRTFLNMMDALEIECYKNIHEILLRPLHSPTSKDMSAADEEATCDICRLAESEPEDEMVFCDGCNVCVHMSCYGLDSLPKDEWLCMKCSRCFGTNPPCVLCPTIGGALKCTKRMDRWVHVVCALWLPECRFGDFEKREPITNIEEIADERWQLKCSVCDTRQGACIQCTEMSCNTAFHVTCGLRSGLEMRIEQHPDPSEDGVAMISLCNQHSSANKQATAPNAEISSGSSANKNETHLQRLENFFFLYVEDEKISKRVGLGRVSGAEIYEYWKLKRAKNDGKPLVKNLQDNIVVNPEAIALNLPKANGARGAMHNPNFKSVFAQNQDRRRLRRCLDMDRNLLTMVLRREKMKRQAYLTDRDYVLSALENACNSTTISQRTASNFLEPVEKIMKPEEVERARALANSFSFLTATPRKNNDDDQKIKNSTSLRKISVPNSTRKRPRNEAFSGDSSPKRTKFDRELFKVVLKSNSPVKQMRINRRAATTVPRTYKQKNEEANGIRFNGGLSAQNKVSRRVFPNVSTPVSRRLDFNSSERHLRSAK